MSRLLGIVNMRWMDKARAYQERLEDGWKQRRIEKEARYRAFLAEPSRPLPGYESLVLWRNRMFIAGFVVLIPVFVQCIFFLGTCFFGPVLEWFPPILTMTAMTIWFFGGLIDLIIFKR